MTDIHFIEDEKPVSPMCEQIQKLEDRLRDIEKLKPELWTAIDGIDNRMSRFQDTILGKVEQINGRSLDVMSKLIQSEKSTECSFSDKFEQEIIKIWDVIKALSIPKDANSNMVYRDTKTPHKCPVCEGWQRIMRKDFDNSIECPSCEGKGIVWG